MKEMLKCIKSTYKDYLEIIAYPSIDLLPWQSKFGGLPFLPKSIPYPTKEDGTPLHLLAQFNFSTIPKLEPFPQKGLLQFYIDQDLAICAENPTDTNGFRVLYIPEVNPYEEQHQFSLEKLPPPKDGFPIDPAGILALEFIKKTMPVSPSDRKYHIVYDRFLNDPELRDDFEDFYSTLCDKSWSNKLGGYPSFCNYDPRENTTEKHDFLLFQIQSSKHVFLCDGVMNFFINEEKLRDLDFTDVACLVDSF